MEGLAGFGMIAMFFVMCWMLTWEWLSPSGSRLAPERGNVRFFDRRRFGVR